MQHYHHVRASRRIRHLSWQVFLGLALLALSGVLFLVHYLIFRDPKEIMIWFMGSLAFLPISVMLVSLVIDRLLRMRERQSRMEKLNMVIGAFFSELGTRLLASFSDLDPSLDSIRHHLVVKSDWSRDEFQAVRHRLRDYEYDVGLRMEYLEDWRRLLTEKRAFLLRLLENPNLLEHEAFTDLLRAVFHLTEELGFREDLRGLPDTDYEHLRLDARRAYVLLVREWLDYMHHLRDNYPYLFSLAIRTNPFDQSASPVVR